MLSVPITASSHHATASLMLCYANFNELSISTMCMWLETMELRLSLDHWQVLGDSLGLTVSDVLEAESKKRERERVKLEQTAGR